MSCVTESLGLGHKDNLRIRWYRYKPWPWPENMNKHKYLPKTKTKVSHRGEVCLHSAQCVLQITNQHKSFANPITSSHHQIQTPSAKKKVRGECLRAAKVPLINQAACSRMYRWKYFFSQIHVKIQTQKIIFLLQRLASRKENFQGFCAFAILNIFIIRDSSQQLIAGQICAGYEKGKHTYGFLFLVKCQLWWTILKKKPKLFIHE